MDQGLLTDEKIRVLLVADNPGDIDLINSCLTDPPFLVDKIRSLDKLWLYLRHHHYHVIIIDHSLPGVTGSLYLDIKNKVHKSATLVMSEDGFERVEDEITGVIWKSNLLTTLRQGIEDRILQHTIGRLNEARQRIGDIKQ